MRRKSEFTLFTPDGRRVKRVHNANTEWLLESITAIQDVREDIGWQELCDFANVSYFDFNKLMSTGKIELSTLERFKTARRLLIDLESQKPEYSILKVGSSVSFTFQITRFTINNVKIIDYIAYLLKNPHINFDTVELIEEIHSIHTPIFENDVFRQVYSSGESIIADSSSQAVLPETLQIIKEQIRECLQMASDPNISPQEFEKIEEEKNQLISQYREAKQGSRDKFVKNQKDILVRSFKKFLKDTSDHPDVKSHFETHLKVGRTNCSYTPSSQIDWEIPFVPKKY